MTWPSKLPLWAATLALLAGCAANMPLLPPPPTPRPLAQPLLSAADIRKAEQHAYWAGYTAGRRYQKQQDAQNTPDAPSPAPVDQEAAAPAAVPPPVVASALPAPVQPVPPPAESYSAKGPARPVATPLN